MLKHYSNTNIYRALCVHCISRLSHNIRSHRIVCYYIYIIYYIIIIIIIDSSVLKTDYII